MKDKSASIAKSTASNKSNINADTAPKTAPAQLAVSKVDKINYDENDLVMLADGIKSLISVYDLYRYQMRLDLQTIGKNTVAIFNELESSFENVSKQLSSIKKQTPYLLLFKSKLINDYLLFELYKLIMLVIEGANEMFYDYIYNLSSTSSYNANNKLIENEHYLLTNSLKIIHLLCTSNRIRSFFFLFCFVVAILNIIVKIK
jgi:hypothetical protein